MEHHLPSLQLCQVERGLCPGAPEQNLLPFLGATTCSFQPTQNSSFVFIWPSFTWLLPGGKGGAEAGPGLDFLLRAMGSHGWVCAIEQSLVGAVRSSLGGMGSLVGGRVPSVAWGGEKWQEVQVCWTLGESAVSSHASGYVPLRTEGWASSLQLPRR